MSDASNPDPERRTLILLPAAAAVPFEFGSASRSKGGDLAEALVTLFRHAASARIVGRRYLEVSGEIANPSRLSKSLAIALGLSERRVIGPTALARALKKRCRRDFAEGRVVRIDGVSLATTEAQACALMHLTSKGAGMS